LPSDFYMSGKEFRDKNLGIISIALLKGID
jgi:hypothetical protein